MGSFTRSENQAIVPLISTPKILKLKYVKLQDVWRNFQEEIFGNSDHKSLPKNNKMKGTKDPTYSFPKQE